MGRTKHDIFTSIIITTWRKLQAAVKKRKTISLPTPAISTAIYQKQMHFIKQRVNQASPLTVLACTILIKSSGETDKAPQVNVHIIKIFKDTKVLS